MLILVENGTSILNLAAIPGFDILPSVEDDKGLTGPRLVCHFPGGESVELRREDAELALAILNLDLELDRTFFRMAQKRIAKEGALTTA